MKLKTLKDFEWNHDRNYVIMREIKQEAIKEHILLNDHYKSCEEFPFKILDDRERKVLQSYIKWKNNLTEEDLK